MRGPWGSDEPDVTVGPGNQVTRVAALPNGPSPCRCLTRMRQQYSLIGLAGMALCACCSETVQPLGDARGASSIEVRPGTVRLVPGDSVRLTAVASDASGAAVPGASFVWTSSRTALAGV